MARKYQLGDLVLVDFDKGREDWNALTLRHDHIEQIGKIGTIRMVTPSNGRNYYKLSGNEQLDNMGYFHEDMLKEANLDPQEAETRLVRGELSFDAYERMMKRAQV